VAARRLSRLIGSYINSTDSNLVYAKHSTGWRYYSNWIDRMRYVIMARTNSPQIFMREQGITPQTVEGWKSVRVPKNDQISYEGPVAHDLVTEVQPLDDTWLLESSRTPEEIDYVLEGRLQEIQLSLQDIEYSPIAQKYGITHLLSAPSERLIAYAELMDEYDQLSQGHRTRAETLRTDLDTEKEGIKEQVRERKMKQGKSKKIIHETASRYAGQMNVQREKEGKARRVQDLIARKFILDNLSAGGDQQEQPITYLSSALNHTVESFGDKEAANTPLHTLISHISDHLRSADDTYLLRQFRYKRNGGLTSRQEDMEVLHAVQNMTFNPDYYTGNPATQNLIRNLGESMVVFMKRQALFQSQQAFTSDRPYPALSFMYDLANSTLAASNPSLDRNMARLMTQYFSDYIESPSVMKEIRKLTNSSYENMKNAVLESEKNGNTPKAVQINGKLLPVPRKIPTEFINLLTSHEWRLFNGLSIGNARFLGGNAMFTESGVLNRVSSNLYGEERSQRSRLSKDDSETIRKFEHFLRDQYTVESIIRSQSINFDMFINASVDIANYTHDQITQSGIDAMNRDERIKDLIEIDRDIPKGLEEYITLLESYFLHFWAQEFYNSARSQEQLEQYEEENRYLWNEVLDNQKWFVSPRGDRFNGDDDPLLQERFLDSMTFRIEREHPQEYIVDLTMPGIQTPIRLWLDRHRNVRDRDRGVLLVDRSAKTAFTNAILKRLYYITSGLLSKDPTGEENGDGDSLNLEYRRAHYTILNSTSTRPITMTSHGALIHAQEVLEQYGIDIFAEIARRRRIGRLMPHQYLTFTREVTPEVVARNILPNIIKFDPTAIEFPAQSAPSSEQ